MRVLIAVDKFKGSLPAVEVAGAIGRALTRQHAAWECDECPIADGGEGTAAAVVAAMDGQWVECEVIDAQCRPVRARYGVVRGPDGARQAVMEMSAASGLALVSDLPPDPLRATTHGTGQMLRHAARAGAGSILIGIGGSATNDAGIGMAAAIGWRFFNAAGEPVNDLPARAEDVARAMAPAAGTGLPPIVVACDVNNPLLGAGGASAVYGPQKGVRDVSFFDNRLRHIAEVMREATGSDPREVPGAGAAGGLGWGLMAFAGARLESGFDIVARLVGLRERIGAADLVITGEGRIDAQTLHGKGPHGVALLARQLGKPVVAIAGGIEDREALEAHFDLLLATRPPEMPLAEALALGSRLVEETVERHASRLMELARR